MKYVHTPLVYSQQNAQRWADYLGTTVDELVARGAVVISPPLPADIEGGTP